MFALKNGGSSWWSRNVGRGPTCGRWPCDSVHPPLKVFLTASLTITRVLFFRNHLERAESKLRRKLLRWKPRYSGIKYIKMILCYLCQEVFRLDIAGNEYCLAATHLLKGNMLEDGVDSLIKVTLFLDF